MANIDWTCFLYKIKTRQDGFFRRQSFFSVIGQTQAQKISIFFQYEQKIFYIIQFVIFMVTVFRFPCLFTKLFEFLKNHNKTSYSIEWTLNWATKNLSWRNDKNKSNWKKITKQCLSWRTRTLWWNNSKKQRQFI